MKNKLFKIKASLRENRFIVIVVILLLVLSPYFKILNSAKAEMTATGWVQKYDPNPNNDDSAKSIIVDGNDVFVAENQEATGYQSWHVQKRDAGNGEILSEIMSTPDQNQLPGSLYHNSVYSNIAMDNDSIYVGGNTSVDPNGANDVTPYWRVEKYLKSDLSRVWDYHPTTFNGEVHALLVDNGYIYAAGYSIPSGKNPLWRIEKIKIDGTTSPACAACWAVTSDIYSGTNEEKVTSMIIDNGALYVAGTGWQENNHGGTNEYKYKWRIEKRNIDNGALITTSAPFSAGYIESQVVVNNPGLTLQYRPSRTILAADTNSFYLASYHFVTEQPGSTYRNTEWDLKKYLKTDFSVQATFIKDYDPSQDNIEDMLIDNNYIYLVGNDWKTLITETEHLQQQIEILNKSDLSEKWSRHSLPAGYSSTNNPNDILSVAKDADNSIYIAGFDSASSRYEWWIEKIGDPLAPPGAPPNNHKITVEVKWNEFGHEKSYKLSTFLNDVR